MTDTIYEYDAFISYRHLDPDQKIAERIQILLETYKPPRGVGNRTSIRKIFRDKTDLPTSRDLSASIISALERSEFLIVIVSENLKASEWCMEEIRTFKKLHHGKTDHIIPVIVSGEPKEVLPEELLYEESCTVDENGVKSKDRKSVV